LGAGAQEQPKAKMQTPSRMIWKSSSINNFKILSL